jgi:beta-mannosidase
VVALVSPDRVVFREMGSDDPWLPGEVPGSVHTDLLNLGRIPDPFVADNELQVQWVAERAWEYRVLFDVDPAMVEAERVFLVCEGLDTLARVSFNGEPLGETDNMFRRYRWDVTDVLKAGENEMHVTFASTVETMLEAQADEPLIGPSQSIPGGAHVRKAPCQFGWDWGPQLPPVGIWKPVRLEAHTTARLENVHVRQQHQEDGEVTVRTALNLERWHDADLKAVCRIEAPDGTIIRTEGALPGRSTSGELMVTIEDPDLWWPNGYGSQPLYEVEVTLLEQDQTLDRRAFQLGLRTLELRREPDAFGTSFTFWINGVPIFAKGANWIPADSFPTRLTRSHLDRLLQSAAEANMNMLRVWGGGLYESDDFYELCDAYGLLVWQDFTFACSIYPTDGAFFDNVQVEARQNIRRLRHHASLALWCGNNEMEWGWAHWGWKDRVPARYKEAYDEMFHHLLPQLCAAEDPERPYWPSSPSSGDPSMDPASVRAGDTHDWEVWHGNQPFEHYRNHPTRFVSEFGFQSLPALDTIRTYADEEDWNMTSYIMEHHQRNAAGNGKIINYMTDHFQLPKDFESLVILTQLLQAEAIRTGVEYWRRSRERTSGALYWQLNDCWPVASWASLDYYGRWKALHYAARRFYAPLLLSAEKRRVEIGESATTHATGYLFQPEPGPFVDLYLTNDRVDPWEGAVRWSLETLDGDVCFAGRQDVRVDGMDAIRVRALNLEEDVDRTNEREVVLVYELWQADDSISRGLLSFVPSKHLALSDPGLHASVEATDQGYAITLSAEKVARFVFLSVDAPDEDVIKLSDNFFDLPAGRSVTIQMPKIEGWNAEDVASALEVRSLFDTYA